MREQRRLHWLFLPVLRRTENPATIERVAFYVNEEGEGQDKAKQATVLEHDGWQMVVCDE